MATIKLDPPIEIRIYPETDALEFRTLCQVEKWINQECDFWNKLKAVAENSPNPLKAHLSKFVNAVNEIKQVVDNTKSDSENKKERALNADKNNELQQRIQKFANLRPIASDSPEVKRAETYMATDPNLGLAYLAANGMQIHSINDILNQPHQNDNKKEAFNYWVQAQAIKAIELKELPTPSEYEAVGLQDVKKELDQFKAELSNELENLKLTHQEQDANFQSTHSQLQRLGRKFFEKNRRDIEDFKRRYKEELALKEPVTYWTDKKDSHKKSARLWGFSFVSSIILGVVIFLSQYESFLNLVSTNGSSVSLGSLFIVVAPFFLYVWLLRILSRLLLGNLNLMRDAEERSVMTETFLSLSDQGGYITDNDRILILHSLFRSATSDHGDDAAPPHWFDMLTNRMRGSSN